jgi:1-pyrroline-5-carboxylate dehydrogenase
MESGKKLTYVNLLADETIHEKFEKALDEMASDLGHDHPMIIDGEEVRAASEFAVRSPFDTRIIVGKFQKGEHSHVSEAVVAAREGFLSWGRRSWQERLAILRRTADRLEEQMFLLSAVITYECGKNRYEALAEVSESVDMIRYQADTLEENNGYMTDLESEGSGVLTRSVMRPYGVFAVISPFNFPLSLAAGMAAAALACGNTVILKPTSTAPFSVLRLHEAFIHGGIPPSAVHYITGPGRPLGEAIVSSPGIDGIAFTGSREAGMWIQREFNVRQPFQKPVIAEMGSKNPVIVTARADISEAVEGVVKSAFGYSGQKCSATSRVYAQEGIADDFILRLGERASTLVIGDPRREESFIGPVIEETALRRFEEVMKQARKDGGKVITGGAVLRGGEFDAGYYVEPTVVTGLPTDHPLARRELFVPVLLVFTFSRLEEALREANATEYGLTAGIFSRDAEEVEFFFENIESGVTYANRKGGATTGAWPGYQSFGGWKGSGSTGKGIGGPYYLLSYLHEQTQTRIGI